MKLYDWYRNTIRNSKYRWLIILGTLAYLLSPIDLLPDVIPGIGQIDDGLLLTLLIAEVSQVLLEKVKTRRGTEPTETVDGAPVNADTVDVKATPVK
ncbi:YkvA family protein [Phormidesmis priestleyi]